MTDKTTGQSDESGTPGSGKQLLIADDTPANLEMLVSILEPHGHQISVALDGKRALQLAQKISPSVILLDISMPGMNGFEVCRLLKSDPKTEHIPVIFVTAGTDNLTEAYELGAADCLIRPLNESHLVARINNCLRIQELSEQKVRTLEDELGARFHSLVNNVPDGIVTINEHCIIETFNPAAEKLFQYTANEVIGQNVNVLMPSPYHEEHDGYVERYLKTGQPKVIGIGREVTAQRKDGTEFPIELVVSEFTMEGNLMFAGIIRDITERKRAHAELDQLNSELAYELGEKKKALERLESTQKQMIQAEKMAALGGLVAGVAHEINTPIGVGVTAASSLQHACAELLKNKQAGSIDDAELQKFTSLAGEATDLILNNLNRAASLISSFKLIAVDQSSEQKRRFNLQEYTQEVLRNLGPKLKQQKIKLDIDIPPDIEMNSYPGALSMVLTNFAINSMLHAFDENMQNPEISIAASLKDDAIVLTYADNGRGMSEVVREKIFDPFFTTKRGRGGSGLGLHLVFNLVTQTLHGNITVKSEENKGTTFTLNLPLET